jgi:hypothetical protein
MAHYFSNNYNKQLSKQYIFKSQNFFKHLRFVYFTLQNIFYLLNYITSSFHILYHMLYQQFFFV